MIAATFRGSALFIWSRNRWGFPFLATIYTALAITAAYRGGTVQPALAALLILFPLIFPISTFVTAGGSSTQDLLSPQGFFPKQFFSLPAPASHLVLPFMLYATALAAIQWVIAIALIDPRYFALGSDHLWIPFLATSFVPWAQALMWTPLRHKAARVAQWVLLIGVYVTVYACVLNDALSRDLAVALSLVQFPIAYAVAVRGVARSRCGEPSPHVKVTRAEREDRRPETSRMPSASSPQHAMFLLESKLHRWSGKTALIALLPALLIVILLLARLAGGADRNPEGLQMLGRATIALLSVALLILSIATALNFGTFRRQATNQAEAFLMPSFFAVLPLSIGDFVWAKFKAALANMLWVSLGVLVCCWLVAHVSGLTTTWVEQYASWRSQYGLAGMWVLAALRPATLVLLTLSLTVNVMWIALRGPGWNRRFTLANILFAAIGLFVAVGGKRFAQLFGDWPPEVLWVLVAAKVGALVALALRVRSRELLGWGRIGALVALWGTTAATLFGFGAFLLPAGTLAPATALCIGLVLAPGPGALLAPLSLARNRTG